MSTFQDIKDELNAEITRANTATSKTDTTVHNAISSLIDGYGQGGGSSEYKPTLLTEITVNEDVSMVTVDITEEMKSKYDMFVVEFDITLSAIDWLYVGSKNTYKQFYFSKGTNMSRPNNRTIPLFILKNKIDSQFVNVFTQGMTNGSGYFSDKTWNTFDGFVFIPHTSGLNIVSGSTIKLTGVKSIYAN